MPEPDLRILPDRTADPAEWWSSAVDALLDPVYRFVRARVPAEAVDDLVQEIFVAASRGVGQFDHRCPVWNWLVVIARNKIAEHYRRTGARDALIRALDGLDSEDDQLRRVLEDESPLPDEICQRREFQALARAALSALDPDHRDCLMGRYNEDLSLEQLSQRFRISRAAANTRLFRARQDLRQAFLELLKSKGNDQESLP